MPEQKLENRFARVHSLGRAWNIISRGILGIMLTISSQASAKNLALVYRGPAACEGCAEAAADMLRQSDLPFEVHFIGPGADEELTAEALRSAVLYVQPGGGDDLEETLDKHMKQYRRVIRSYVRGGGRYLGICMGGYLAGKPGFDIIPGKVDQYISLDHAQVTNTDDSLVKLKWGDHERMMYFQDGPFFSLSDRNPFTAKTQVIARYANKSLGASEEGEIAAMIVPFHEGKVAVIGPHPEASPEWFQDNELKIPIPFPSDLGKDLLEKLMK